MISANDFRRQWAETRADTLAAVEEVGASGWYVLGREVSDFEQSLANAWPLPHAVGVASGLDAIEICLRALGCGPGAFVLTTPVSAFATTLAIQRSGATAVFVDCDEYGLIDLELCARALHERPEIRFFVPVHLYGHSLDLDHLRHLKETTGVAVVEDCAQSVLASWRGNAVTGTVGDMAATSFYPTKNLGALGDGGAILTSQEDLASRSRVLRDYGQASKYTHSVPGFNSRLDELQAAILHRAHLPRLRAWTEARRGIAAAYLAGIDNPHLRVPGAPAGSDSCWHLFPVFVAPARKADFLTWMRQRGILVAEHYPIAIPDQPAMSAIPHQLLDSCETARRCCRTEVSLPIHPYLDPEQVDTVIAACNEWPG